MPRGLPDSWTYTIGKKILRRTRRLGRSSGSARRSMILGFKLSKIIIYKEQTFRILNTPNGKLWWALHRRGEAIVRGAKRQVGVKTGALRDSIHMRHTGNQTGQYLWIGSKKNYAYIHHEGSRPHKIVAKNAPLLVFKSGTRLVRVPEVNHPGTRANHYLVNPMREHTVRPITIR